MVTGARIRYITQTDGSEDPTHRSIFELDLKMSTYRKAAELTTFAQQRYGCTPLLLMPLP